MKTLNLNKDSAAEVYTKIEGLTGSSRRSAREVPINCNGVLDKVDAFTRKLEVNLTADISAETANILGVTLADGACSSLAEDLNQVKERLIKVVSNIGNVVTNLHEQLGERLRLQF